MMLANNVLLLAIIFLLLHIAWTDFKEFKIRNNSVLLLIFLYLLQTAANGFADIWAELAGGFLLGVIGVVFWLIRLMGAGDAKLYLPIGCLLSWGNLGQFAIYLMLFSCMLLLVLKMPTPWFLQHYKFIIRLERIRQGKIVPYGVPIVLATIVILARDFQV